MRQNLSVNVPLLLSLVACRDAKRDSSGDPLDLPAGPTCAPDGGWPVETPFNRLLAHLAAGEMDDALLADLEAVVAWAEAQGGPWRSITDGPYRADDGVRFVADGPQVAIPAFSVPDLVVDDEGGRWMLGVNGDLDALVSAAAAGTPMEAGVIGLCGLAAARLDEAGGYALETVRIAGDVPACVVDPEVRRGPDGRWHLLFLGIHADEACADAIDPASVPAPHRLYDAVSDDLLDWTLLGVAAEVAVAGLDPTVWCDGATCGGWMGVGLSSEDGGLSFTVDEGVSLPIEPDTPEALRGEAGVRIYTAERGVPVTLWSEDGRVFAEETDPTYRETDLAIHTALLDADGSVIGYR